MKRSPRRWQHTALWTLLLVSLLAASPLQDFHFKLSQQLEIFASVLTEIDRYIYASDIAKAVKTGIHAMIQSLDPYAQFVTEDDTDGLQDFVAGEHSGIGAVIDIRQEKPTVMALYKDCPAHKGGLRVGDIITQVNGEEVMDQSIAYIRRLFEGMPDTRIQLTVVRPLSSTPLTLTLTREKLRLKSVPYFSTLQEGIGYIRLARFMSYAADEVRAALDSLQAEGAWALILDLRGNPGGILEEAVSVANLFIEQGQPIVTTQGKETSLVSVFTTEQPAHDPDIPVVALIDQQSASCAEIVAGVLQDYDRAVLMGNSTFGKGLVQVTTPLCYDTQLTLTAAKYYIPSGRGIYKDPQQQAVTSARQAFATQAGRLVYEGDGITPDIEQDKLSLAPISHSLVSSDLIFDYATLFQAQYKRIAPPKNFALSDAQYGEFMDWLQDKVYPYSIEQNIAQLQQQTHVEAYAADVREQIDALRARLQSHRLQDLQHHASEIKLLLQEAIVQRYYPQEGIIEVMLTHDQSIRRACALLKDPLQYRRILQADAE
ncbi:MAG: S41 family peptidase [Bacteroidota bacterium]